MNKKQLKKIRRAKLLKKKANVKRNKPVKQFHNDVFNSCPTMIHENDFIPHDCCLCDARIETVHDSHNPFPLTDIASALSENGKENPTRCCSSCDMKIVLPARIVSRTQGTHKEQWAKYDNGSIYYELAGIQKEVA